MLHEIVTILYMPYYRGKKSVTNFILEQVPGGGEGGVMVVLKSLAPTTYSTVKINILGIPRGP
jgi:hypothetical protein